MAWGRLVPLDNTTYQQDQRFRVFRVLDPETLDRLTHCGEKVATAALFQKSWITMGWAQNQLASEPHRYHLARDVGRKTGDATRRVPRALAAVLVDSNRPSPVLPRRYRAMFDRAFQALPDDRAEPSPKIGVGPGRFASWHGSKHSDRLPLRGVLGWCHIHLEGAPIRCQ